MLQQFPGAVGSAVRSHAAQLNGELGNGSAEVGMSAFSLQKPIDFLSQGLNRVHAPYHMCSGMWLTIPNLVTLVRILMTPFILIELSRGEYLIGGWSFGAAAFTDVLDGALARRFGGQSKAGQYLDPIADKVLLSCVYIGLAAGGAVPLWIVVLIFARDLWILLLSGFALQFTRFRELRPSLWGKASTFFQIMAAVAVMSARAYGNDWFLQVSKVLLAGVAILAVVSGLDYSMRGVAYLRGLGSGTVDLKRSRE